MSNPRSAAEERREFMRYATGPRPRDGIRDQILFMSSARDVRPAAFNVLLRVEDCQPAHQVMGTAVALYVMCEALRLPVRDVMTRAQNMMTDAESFSPQIRAIRDYATNEILRIPGTREELGLKL